MRTVYVVPHCHWDREWYQPHELFRWRLVQMIDELLDHMEQHPEYRCFTLDGQTIVIEDYLELRPEDAGRLRAMVESGRIAIGPWWVQPDEFLPSGESHIRSLQRGIRQAQTLGGGLCVGHCADQFGHIAQMPQIMAQLGLTSACLWRGVPDAIAGWSFQWEAPDGTRLPVLYLRNSYSSGWRLPEEPRQLVERVRRQERDRRDDEPALLMNGTDHSRMEKHVPGALAAAAGHGYDFRLATLGEYERAQLAAGIDDVVHEGELRSPDRSNVLVGVLSARMNIKQRDFQVGSVLERVAEPLELLAWLHGGPDGLPALKHAWRLALENTPHDSICGCSADQTHREMFPRYDRAEQLARQVAREAMGHIVGRMEAPAVGGVAIFRPVPHAPAVIECEVPDTWEQEGWLRLADGRATPYALTFEERGEPLRHEEVSPEGALRHLDFIREGRYDNHYVEGMTWSLEDRRLRVTTAVGDALNTVDCDAVRREVREVVANNLADTAEVVVYRPARRTLHAVLPASDTIGVQLLTPVPATGGEGGRELDAGFQLDVATGEASISNQFYEVRLRKGGLHVRDWQHAIDLRNVNAFVDEGDRGDEYNADILPDAVTRPESREVLAVTANAVSATLRYLTILEVPQRLNARRTRRPRRDSEWLPVLTEVTLWTAVPWVDFRVTVHNESEDHRLRTLFPLPFEITHAITENQFHVATRPLAPAPWNGVSLEQPPTTFPQKTFAAFEADGLGVAVFNRGLPEGEVVRDAEGRQAYALTLLRAVGWLSRPDLVSRHGGAGPMLATPDAQLPGSHTFEYALTTYRGGWREARVQPLAHGFAHRPLAYATNGHEGSRGQAAPLARFDSPLMVPSALHRSHADGAPIARVYSAAEGALDAALHVPGGSPGAGLTDLLERHVGDVESGGEGWRFPLRPWQIATVRFGRRE
ncbi:MAG: hypothetical protein HYX53_16260 [Chloroflexi bacterium]|nr:hypothetical protein [Chloroflexota bacterium]